MAEQEQTQTERFIKFMTEKRKRMGLSTTDLAVKAFNTPNRKGYISDLENNRRKGLTLESMSQILKALDTEIQYYEF
jgi:transcriptional regulator with XRE-family HTH domain